MLLDNDDATAVETNADVDAAVAAFTIAVQGVPHEYIAYKKSAYIMAGQWPKPSISVG